MSDLVAVPRADLDRLLDAARASYGVMSGTTRSAFDAVASAAKGPAVMPPPGRAPYGFGWAQGEVVALQGEQQVIERIRRLRGLDGSGLSFRQIADRLNRDGVRAPSGGLWRSESVRRVINREAAT